MTPTVDTTEAPVGPRLDRPVLVSNLVAGALCLSPLAFASVPLLLAGAVYVAAGSVFLAAVHARRVLTRRREALAWAAPWLAAVAVWTVALGSTDDTVSGYLFGLYVGLVVATPGYLVWQVAALAVRHVLAWRSGRPFVPS